MDIIVDTLSFRANFDSYSEMLSFMRLDGVDFSLSEKKFNVNYTHSFYYNGIRIGCDGQAGWGFYIHMSGKGCRTYEDIQGPGFDWLGDLISQLYLKVYKKEAAVTRIDLACDEHDAVFDINILENHIANDMFLSRCPKTSIRLVKFGEECLYVGSPQSLSLLRIYNKKLERGFVESDDEVPHWWRCEFQLRDGHAEQIIKEWYKSSNIGKIYSGHVLKHIRFVNQSNKKDGNQKRFKTAEWWSDFLEHANKIDWVSVKGSDYNLTKLERYAIGNAGSSVKTLIESKQLTADELYNLYTQPDIKLRLDQRHFIAKHLEEIQNKENEFLPSYEKVCQCERCGRVASSDEFIYYKGSLGLCRNCS